MGAVKMDNYSSENLSKHPGKKAASGTGQGAGDATDRSSQTRPVMKPDVPVSTPPGPVSATPPAQPAGAGIPPRPRRAARQRRRPGYQQRATPVEQSFEAVGVVGPPPPQMRRRDVRGSGLYFPWWSLVVMVGFVGAVAVGMVLVFASMSETQVLGDQPPRVQIMTSPPTLSQDFLPGAAPGDAQPAYWPTPIPQIQPTATVPLPTPVPSLTLPPGDFSVGILVEVVGVGASGLNIRSAPGGTIRFVAREGEAFLIVDGPQTSGDFEWWRLEDPNDPNRFGWAARNYLTSTSQQ